MIKRNPSMQKLTSSYLFLEINKRKNEYLKQHPESALISLGIGDTTEPLPECVIKAMMMASLALGIRSDYTGYGPEAGLLELREQIASTFYKGIQPDEIFVSDGAKCDTGRLQVLFGGDCSIGIQDPSYPVYLDGSLIQGIENIHLMPCLEEDNFFPNLELLPELDLLYICSPNNPTGIAYTKPQLEELVNYALQTNTLIIFDAAYSAFIQSPDLPKSIFEIEGAKKVAIELNSFSKLAGFTGIRLGWSVVPKELKYRDGTSIHSDWNRITSTLFNGASIISQRGGLAVLTPKGFKEVQNTISFYLENASLLKKAFEDLEFKVFGGTSAPYLWIKVPGLSSWEAFQMLLDNAQIVSTPGSGFGEAGEGFIRLSAFGSRENILEAIKRIEIHFKSLVSS